MYNVLPENLFYALSSYTGLLFAGHFSLDNHFALKILVRHFFPKYIQLQPFDLSLD